MLIGVGVVICETLPYIIQSAHLIMSAETNLKCKTMVCCCFGCAGFELEKLGSLTTGSETTDVLVLRQKDWERSGSEVEEYSVV